MAGPQPTRTTEPAASLAARYEAVRKLTLELVARLSDADASVQSMPDASPAKWHLAHTTWFFETFLLRDHVPGYALHDGAGRSCSTPITRRGRAGGRASRGLLTRPSLAEVVEYRARVDEAMPGAAAARPRSPRSGRARDQSRAAAPGIAADRHQAPVLLNPLGPAVWPEAGARPPCGDADRSNGSPAPPGSSRSATGARASPSTAKGRRIAASSRLTSWPRGR